MTTHLSIEVLLRERDQAAASYHYVKESLVLRAVMLWQAHHAKEQRGDFNKAAEEVWNVEKVYRRISKELEDARRAYKRRIKVKAKRPGRFGGR